MNGMSHIDLVERYAVLRLATRWHCQGLQSLALDSLERFLAPLEKVRVARACGVHRWLVQAYTELALRADPLSVTDAQQVDAEDVVHIFSARECISRRRLSSHQESVVSHFANIASNTVLPSHADQTTSPTWPDLPTTSRGRHLH